MEVKSKKSKCPPASLPHGLAKKQASWANEANF